MKKWIWAMVAAAVLLLPRMEHTGTDISRLEPVELVWVSMDEKGVQVKTDTGAAGYGKELESAVENLHAAASAEVFLDTAEYLLLDGQAEELLPDLCQLLRPACKVSRVDGEPDLEGAAEYLQVHPPEVKLLDCRAGQVQLQTLYYQEGRGSLAQ